MHRLTSSFILGYHGCDRDIAEKLLAGERFNLSQNDYDWLGEGAYFWEANPLRGLEFARELQARRSDIQSPYVVGAVIDPGFCLDLTTSLGIAAVGAAHDDFRAYCAAGKISVPENIGGTDLLRRRLDCAVINHLHEVRKRGRLPPFDTVKGVFLEGDRIYPTAGFYRKTHIQVCVRNLDCIKGVFRVPDEQLETT